MKVRLFLTCTLVALLALAGCRVETETTSHDGHDHGDGHDHASSLHEGVERLEAMQEEIAGAFTTGQPSDADAALHSVGHLIDDDIVGLANKSELSADDKKAVKDAADILMAKYGELHDAVHGKAAGEVDTSVYDSVAKDIEEAIGTLHRLAHEEGHDAQEGDHDDDGTHDQDHEGQPTSEETAQPQEGQAAPE